MIILHGDDIASSRNKLFQIIKQKKISGIKEIITLDGNLVQLHDIKQAVESQSLFGTYRLVIIENLFLIKSKTKDEIINYLKQEKKSENIIAWEGKIISSSSLSKFPKEWQILLFKTSASVFKFLDSLKPGNNKQALIYLQHCKKTEAPELILYFFTRRITDLLISKDLGKKGLTGFQGWQANRLLSQSSYFSKNQLIDFHNRIYYLDKSVKTGNNVLPLSSSLDLLVAEL